MTRHKVTLEFTMPESFKEGDVAAGLIEEAINEIAEADPWRHTPFSASNGVRIDAPHQRPRPMEVFIDAEWNGYGGALITMALVAMSGEELYVGIPLLEKADPWVRRHVLPVVGEEVEGVTGPMELASRLAGFLAQFEAVHLIADWPEDIERFCRALITGPGMRINTPPLTMEIRRDLDSAQSALPHNALEDARALRASYLTLMTDC